MPIRLCMEPRCPNPVRDAGSKGRCELHYRQLERERGRARRADARERNRFYARKRWAMTRRHKLYLNPLCELGHPGCLRIANEVHHRQAMENGGDEYAIDNLISVCKPCHSRETRHEQGRRRVADYGPSAA
jgi:5-methylcytosine-specific restriction enzyme A